MTEIERGREISFGGLPCAKGTFTLGGITFFLIVLYTLFSCVGDSNISQLCWAVRPLLSLILSKQSILGHLVARF